MVWGTGDDSDYQLNCSLSLRFLKPFFDNILLELGGLPYVLPLTVHLDFCAEQLEGVILHISLLLFESF